jgi:hypothetical protein
MRCANGYRLETRSMRRCVYRKQPDLETLVATRGPNFPLGRLEVRLMCPASALPTGTTIIGLTELVLFCTSSVTIQPSFSQTMGSCLVS